MTHVVSFYDCVFGDTSSCVFQPGVRSQYKSSTVTQPMVTKAKVNATCRILTLTAHLGVITAQTEPNSNENSSFCRLVLIDSIQGFNNMFCQHALVCHVDSYQALPIQVVELRSKVLSQPALSLYHFAGHSHLPTFAIGHNCPQLPSLAVTISSLILSNSRTRGPVGLAGHPMSVVGWSEV